MIIESLRCPYCLAAVEIRHGDGWSCYWCIKHGAVEPISFSTELAGFRISQPGISPSAGCLPPPLVFPPPVPPFAGGGFFIESSRMHPAAMMPFSVTNLITTWSGASREGLSNE